jgi:plastocyanin
VCSPTTPRILPERLRFQNWKRWMRTELALWWAVVLIGAATYYVWYMAPQSKAAPPPASAAAAEVVVKVSNFEFAPKEVTVKPGATVAWVDEGGRHSVVADDGSFQSEVLTAGSRFEHEFDSPGTYPYYCGFHGGKGGKDMAGVVRVAK